MLPKINRQNRNNGNIDPDIKDELESGNNLSVISNEAAEKYGDLLNPSNEANPAPETEGNQKPGNDGERLQL